MMSSLYSFSFNMMGKLDDVTCQKNPPFGHLTYISVSGVI